MPTTEARITTLIAEHLGIYLEERPTGIESTFAEPGADSLDMVELAMSIEDHFSIEISDDELGFFAPDLPKARTVAEMVALVDAKLAGKAVAA